MLNPRWNEKNQRNDKQFIVAMEMATKEFFDHLNEIVLSWIPARDVVRNGKTLHVKS
jgi:hypothetical protein